MDDFQRVSQELDRIMEDIRQQALEYRYNWLVTQIHLASVQFIVQTEVVNPS